MKNKMADVRNHLVAMLEELGDKDCKPETVERAKAMSQVAGTYIGAVKVELDALRLAAETGHLPAAVGADTVALEAPKPRLVGGR